MSAEDHKTKTIFSQKDLAAIDLERARLIKSLDEHMMECDQLTFRLLQRVKRLLEKERVALDTVSASLLWLITPPGEKAGEKNVK